MWNEARTQLFVNSSGDESLGVSPTATTVDPSSLTGVCSVCEEAFIETRLITRQNIAGVPANRRLIGRWQLIEKNWGLGIDFSLKRTFRSGRFILEVGQRGRLSSGIGSFLKYILCCARSISACSFHREGKRVCERERKIVRGRADEISEDVFSVRITAPLWIPSFC